MNDRDTQTPTTPAVQDAVKATLDGINQLKSLANDALRGEFQAITEAARQDDGCIVSSRLERHNTMSDLVGGAAWLARDLVDVLLKVATDNDPHSVMGSDIPARIREAEIRLQLLREMSR
ncbi:MAG: hypothetical protein GY820_04585 [Gammaproteobacteria bacterium]|nr:hypothetical protein [Gammaproteobacteria bacterium]